MKLINVDFTNARLIDDGYFESESTILDNIPFDQISKSQKSIDLTNPDRVKEYEAQQKEYIQS